MSSHSRYVNHCQEVHTLPAPPSCLGKYMYVVSIGVSTDLSVWRCQMGGCRSQGCHGYPTHSARFHLWPHPPFRHHSPSSSIGDEFKERKAHSMGYFMYNQLTDSQDVSQTSSILSIITTSTFSRYANWQNMCFVQTLSLYKQYWENKILFSLTGSI